MPAARRALSRRGCSSPAMLENTAVGNRHLVHGMELPTKSVSLDALAGNVTEVAAR